MAEAVRIVHEADPELEIDGEMQADTALDAAEAQVGLPLQPSEGPGQRAGLLAAVRGQRRLQAPGRGGRRRRHRAGAAGHEQAGAHPAAGVLATGRAQPGHGGLGGLAGANRARFRGSSDSQKAAPHDGVRLPKGDTPDVDPDHGTARRRHLGRRELRPGESRPGAAEARPLEPVSRPALRGVLRPRRRTARPHGRPPTNTAPHTGRSPNDKFIVRDADHRGDGGLGQGQRAHDAGALRRRCARTWWRT